MAQCLSLVSMMLTWYRVTVLSKSFHDNFPATCSRRFVIESVN